MEPIRKIREKFKTGRVKFSVHAQERIDERQVLISEIQHVIYTGEVIEEYPGDRPYPSYLVLGYAAERQTTLCAVCAGRDFNRSHSSLV